VSNGGTTSQESQYLVEITLVRSCNRIMVKDGASSDDDADNVNDDNGTTICLDI